MSNNSIKIDKHRVNVKLIRGRKWVKRAMIATKGVSTVNDIEKLEKQLKWRLSDEIFVDMLLGKHSPIEEMVFWIDLYVPERVHTHLVRHEEVGKYVATSRPDIKGHISISSGMRFMSMSINAKRLIEISDQRLCNKASPETRLVWEDVVRQCIEIEPILVYVLKKPCIKHGYCIEGSRSCGYNYVEKYDLHKKDINNINKGNVR